MIMKKPNQIIDEITNMVYPPQEAILPQLYSIKTIAASTGKVYEATEDIHSIFPNLDAMQRIINYLRGAPIRDELKPPPEDKLKPVFTPSAPGINVILTLNRAGEYEVSIVGTDVEPTVVHPELFGNILDTMQVVEMQFKIPVVCGKNYLVTQINPVLEYYKDDPSIQLGTEDEWIKEKIYMMDEDFFEYAFLLQEGRSKIRISLYADYEDPIIFNINSHIHFKRQEEPTPPESDEGDNNNNEDSSIDGTIRKR